MMIAYLNTVGHPVVQLPVAELAPQLEEKVWGDWSPMTVLAKMDAKKYAANAARIRKADLKYPIIITGTGTIVDGYHRAAAAVLKERTHIDAYVFRPALIVTSILLEFINICLWRMF
jgi:ParB-like chromosome segregation protein Spo0J